MKRALQFLVSLVLGGLAVVSIGTTAGAQTSGDVEVILAIDASGSMADAIEAAKSAANEFVASMPPNVAIGLETFADTVTVLSPPTTDRSVLTTQIASITASGDTALYDLVVTASRHFTPTVEHKVLVVLSDGKDEGSLATLDDAIASAEGLQIEAISLTTSLTDLDSLRALGAVTAADDAAGVSAAFARVAGLLVDVIESATVPSSAVPPATTITAPAVVSPAPSVAPAPATTAVAAQATEASTSSTWLLLGAAGIFAGLFMIGLLLFPRERVSKARLGTNKPRSASDIGTRTMSAIDEALERHGKRTDLATALAVADISAKPAEFVATVGVVAVVAGLVGVSLSGPLIGLLVVIAVCFAARFHVRRSEAKRRMAFADQLPDVLQLVTTALRSGFGLTQALESVAEEAQEPARSEFSHVLVESRMGRDLSDSMRALAQRMQSRDLEWVVAAIDINRETGGNLSEVLHTVGATIRERGRIARQVRTLTAEGRLSARILMALPLLMLVWQWRTNPENFELLTYGLGLIALCFAGILMILGGIWVHKIVNSVAL